MAVSSAEFNERVAAAERIQHLGGLRREAPAAGDYKWKVKVQRDGILDSPVGRLQAAGLNANSVDTLDFDVRAWRVYVGMGTVNNRPAAISYLRTNDPRRWTMPADHPAIPEMIRYYGEEFLFIDRSLSERADRPWLQLQTPSRDGTDTGDFIKVTDALRPRSFRSRDAWEYDLFKASVFLTATPGRYSRVEDLVGFPLPTKNKRFRVHVGRSMPVKPFGTAVGGAHELARIYLLRSPGGDPQNDTLLVQQRCFHSLWNANAEPGLGELAFFSVFDDLDLLAGLAGGLGALIALPTLDALNTIIDLELRKIAEDFEAASSVEFWSV